MLDKLKRHIQTQLPFLFQKKLIIAISGGIDSVVLTHMCKALGLDIALAHCNFGLRGEESDADEAFLIALADNLNLEIFIERFATESYAKDAKLSIQMAARELRYRWFEELVTILKFDNVLVAHHADDNLETFFINLSRGTGLDGLIGIPEINGYIVRPFLPFSRDEISLYAADHNLSWREDSSNSSTKYLRNKLRHDVVPILKDINPQWLQNFSATQMHLRDSKQLIDDYMSQVYKDVVTPDKDMLKFNISKLKKYPNPKAYLFELLKPYKFTAWQDILHLLESQAGKQVFSETHRLLKDRDFLILTSKNPKPKTIETSYLVNKNLDDLKAGFGTVIFEDVFELGQATSQSIYVDKDKIKAPLTIRKWEQGDYFYPIGMHGKKKLSKYFKDEKLSLLEKEAIWVLCSQNAIVWVIGRRADNRFKIMPKTENILKIAVV